MADTMRIAIIGGGATGVLAALHLARALPDCGAKILIVEPMETIGRGLAYGTGNDNHLLNVPAGKMSAFQDRPGDFVDWLLRQEQGDKGGVPFDEGSFVPRRLFEGFAFGEADRASLELARDILSDAQAQLDRLQGLSRETSAVAIRQKLDHLHAIAAGVVRDVEQKPRRVNNVRRLLTYYLPAAVRLADGYRVLEGSNAPDRERVRATAEMIGRLDEVFGRYADRLSEDEVEGLDVELKLLENSIRDEQRH